jgi:Na+/H+ antiporter NhaD/arsenite permease-like protein
VYALLAGTVLAVTLLLVLTRPWGVNEAWWAALGGGLALLLGLVSFGQAWAWHRGSQSQHQCRFRGLEAFRIACSGVVHLPMG